MLLRSRASAGYTAHEHDETTSGSHCTYGRAPEDTRDFVSFKEPLCHAWPQPACSFWGKVRPTQSIEDTWIHLVNIAQKLATDVLTTRLLVIEDTGRGRLETTSSVLHLPSHKSRLRRHTRIMIPKPRAGRSKLTHASIWLT